MLRRVGCLAVLVAISVLPAIARAESELVMSFAQTFSNNVIPDGTSPWMKAVFKDVAVNAVELTVYTSSNQYGPATPVWGLGASNFISNLYFNVKDEVQVGVDQYLDPIFAPVDLNGLTTSVGWTTAPDAYLGATLARDAFKADGVGGDYDIQFEFNVSNNSTARFNGGDVFHITFTYSTGLAGAANVINASVFNALAYNHGSATFNAAAHVQNIGPTGGLSTYIAGGTVEGSVPTDVPLPAVGWCGVAMMVACAARKGLSRLGNA